MRRRQGHSGGYGRRPSKAWALRRDEKRVPTDSERFLAGELPTPGPASRYGPSQAGIQPQLALRYGTDLLEDTEVSPLQGKQRTYRART
jgi:hypothetical protein